MKRSPLFVMAVTLVMVSCPGPNSRVVTRLNASASLHGDIPVDPLGWRVITSGVNPADATMSTLFGNERAIEYSRSKGGSDYPPGAILSLVTWRQEEDARWFGAQIPSQPQSVEFVTALLGSNGQITHDYKRFEGSPLRGRLIPASRASERIAALLSQHAAVMPE